MAESSAASYLPQRRDLAALTEAARMCRGCELYRDATQTVFGEGPSTAPLVLVGEQPGDQEDRAGHPFVGPAGKILDRALQAAGIRRDSIYLTNAVKHFRFKSTESSTRRIHAKPAAGHIQACLPWLTAELTAVRPTVVVALGATAAGALLGGTFRLTKQRGVLIDWPPPTGPHSGSTLPIRHVLATIHPSAILRGDPANREQGLADLVADLATAAAAIGARI